MSAPSRDPAWDASPDERRATYQIHCQSVTKALTSCPTTSDPPMRPQKGRIRRPYVRSDKTKSRRFAYCAYLSENLDRPLPTKDGGTLRTIHAACDDMTSIGNQRERRQQWQRACNLILAKANVVTVSRALELALFMDAKLEVSKVPAK